jgi:hypothetical protein
MISGTCTIFHQLYRIWNDLEPHCRGKTTWSNESKAKTDQMKPEHDHLVMMKVWNWPAMQAPWPGWEPQDRKPEGDKQALKPLKAARDCLPLRNDAARAQRLSLRAGALIQNPINLPASTQQPATWVSCGWAEPAALPCVLPSSDPGWMASPTIAATNLFSGVDAHAHLLPVTSC